MLKIVVCVSGGGTNLQAIIDGIADGTITNTEIVGVISNNKNAYALERAKKAGISALCISPKDYETREMFNDALLDGVLSLKPDLIVLAGFLVNIPSQMIQAFRNRIINIQAYNLSVICNASCNCRRSSAGSSVPFISSKGFVLSISGRKPQNIYI